MSPSSIVQAARHVRHRHPMRGHEPRAQERATLMLDALGREYPELSGHAIVAALDAATSASGTSARSPREADQATRYLVLALARQRLDLARERTAAATRRLGVGTTGRAPARSTHWHLTGPG